MAKQMTVVDPVTGKELTVKVGEEKKGFFSSACDWVENHPVTTMGLILGAALVAECVIMSKAAANQQQQ